MQDRGHLLTEQTHPAAGNLDRLSIGECVALLNESDRQIAAAVAGAHSEIVAAIELVTMAFRGGGRLIYVGAGTSGRLGVLDAAECPPTFLCDPEQVQGIIAGGPEALQRSVEHAEDDAERGAAEIARRSVGPQDVVFGIAAGGTTPFVHAALAEAHRRGARTVFLSCVPFEQARDDADVSIRVLTGPEVVAGSTRLKAGLATKMVLNMVTTVSMVQLGKVYRGLMVDVNARGCAKLTDRAIRITMQAAGVNRAHAVRLLQDADWHVKTAIVMHRLSLPRDLAQQRLASADGSVARALGQAAD